MYLTMQKYQQTAEKAHVYGLHPSDRWYAIIRPVVICTILLETFT